MTKYLLFIACCLVGYNCLGQRFYHREYSLGKILMAEGWMNNGQKEDYWKFYHANGKVKESGHYKTGKKNKYWCFYDEKGIVLQEGHYTMDKRTNWWKFHENEMQYHVAEFKNDRKNGFCIFYRNKTAYKCEKYENDRKLKEWTDLKSFKRDNKGYFFL